MRSRSVRLGGFAAGFIGTLVAGLPAAGAPLQDENLAKNPGFEVLAQETNSIPAEWFAFSSGDTLIRTSTWAVRSGQRSVQLSAQSVPNGYLGLIQNLPVTPDTEYEFSVHVLNNWTNRLDFGTTGCIDIEWKNSDGAEIWRVVSRWWSNDLSTLRWQEYRVSGRAPGNAATANFVVFLFDDKDGSSKGAFLVDDARIVER